MFEDSYFKDFRLADYKFIVANKKTLCPLVWNFRDTAKKGDLVYGKKQIVLRDPEEIGTELFDYLKRKPFVPNWIELTKPNDIVEWIERYDR